MKKNLWCVIICGALSLALLASGFWMLHLRSKKTAECQSAIDQVLQQQTALGLSENADEQLSTLLTENSTAKEQLAATETEINILNEEAVVLQQEHDRLSQDETVIYYQTILESLTEGMKKVEQYIEGTE